MKLFQRQNQRKTVRGFASFALTLSLLVSARADAQNGYLYIHQKTLNEDPGNAFTFNVSGGSTAVPGFSLNDQSAQLRILDIGAAQNGRMWAIEQNTSKLYYRDSVSNIWVGATTGGVAITNARKVDGDISGNAVYINTAGTVFSSNGTTSTQISTTGAFSGAADIGSGWDGLPYISLGRVIYRYSGSGTTWNTVVSLSAALYNNTYCLDVDPVTKSAFVGLTNASGSERVLSVTSAGVVSDIGLPGTGTTVEPHDIAVNSAGEVFMTHFNTGDGWYVFKYSGSGTVWSAKEAASFDAYSLTGGVGRSLWVTMNGGGSGTGASYSTYPYFNIFARALSGATVNYIDDERLRTTAGNSILIPVAPGTYTITQAAAAGWDLQSILVYDPTSNSLSDQATGTATLTVAAGETVHAVFQNGALNPFTMTSDCSISYLETFGTGATGTFGSLVQGQTSYHFLNNSIPGEDGYYKIVSTAFPDFNTWQATPFYDHTSGNGSGRMYAVNAGYDKGEFFRRRFTGVINGASYTFSAWAANLTPGGASIRPNIRFQVLDHNTQAVLGTFNTGDINTATSVWNQYSFVFTATATDIDLILLNNSIGGTGNDLAIDDISFALTPPATPVVTTTNLGCLTAGTIEVTSPVGVPGTYEYSKNGTTWQAGTTFSGLSAGTYTISARFTITANCINSATTTVMAAICGNVLRDANGLTDNTINGIGLGNPGSITLYANLLNAAGTAVIATVAVNPDGTYTLPATPNASYQVQISMVQGTVGSPTPATTLPGGWIQTGDVVPGNTATALTPGISAVIAVTTESVGGVNFGIEQLPTATAKTFNVTPSTFSATPPATYPVVPGYVSIPSNSTSLTGYGGTGGALSGTDPEDCAAANACNSGKTFTIGTINSNTRLYYDFGAGPVLLTAGTVIPNYDPSKLVIYGQAGSGTSGNPVGFTYTITDAAGKVSPPVAYAIISSSPLPVELVSFTGLAKGCMVSLAWQTANEENIDRYEVENGEDGKSFHRIGTVASNNIHTGSSYHFDFQQNHGIAYYRLKIVSAAKTGYSPVLLLNADCGNAEIRVYPNPASEYVTIAGLTGASTTKIFDVAGKLVQEVKLGANDKKVINMTSYASGVYYMDIHSGDNLNVQRFKIIKL